MNKRDKTAYTSPNKRTNKRRETDMHNNLVHDMEYTFADEYYSDLQNDYYESLKKELHNEDEQESF